MKNILTYQNLLEDIEKINSEKEQIIAFVYAPYNEERIVKIIDQFYDWWNIIFEDSILHFYWLGYISASESKSHRWKVNTHNEKNVYFDMKIFHELESQLNKNWNYKYHDHFEIILIRKYKNHTYFKKKIRLDLENVFHTTTDIKDIMRQINNIVNEYQTFSALEIEIKNRKKVKRLVKVPIELLFEIFIKIVESV